MKVVRRIRIKSFSSLSLRIYTIGYPEMGESILVLLCDGESVLFSVLTDCYSIDETDGVYNHVHSILENYKISQIDAFIWTHPDRDHSVGIENTLNLYDKIHQAEIFIPEGLIFKGKIGDSFCEEACHAIAFIYSHYSDKGSKMSKRHIHTVSTDAPETRDLISFDIYADDEDEPMKCKFHFVLPDSASCNHANYWDMELEHNTMSIVYFIELRGRKYLFTGDLMDGGARKIEKEFFSKINYIKIPHHGSCHSEKFLGMVTNEYYKDDSHHWLTSTVTRFNRSNDPKDRILKMYSKLGDVFHITNDKTNKVGCIETIIDIINDECFTNCEGSASQYQSQQ